MTGKIVVLSTCESEQEAARLAELLVREKLAACVNILSAMRSVYRWEGKLENTSEVLLLIKSSHRNFEQLRQTLEANHSYQVPEVVALPVLDGSPGYLKWLDQELADE